MIITNRTGLRPLAAATALALVLVACGGGGDDAADTTTASTEAPTTTAAAPTTTARAATTTEAETTTTTTVPPTPREPLSGVEIASFDDIDPKPALAVKINNHPAARRNHSGLGSADIVFEELVEGTITRFAAVFHSAGSDPVGPIRSGRSQDVDLLTSFREPLFAWSGGNPGVTRLIAESTLTDLNPFRTSAGGAYYRGPGSTPHNFYSTTDRLWALTPEDHPGPPPQQYRYLDEGEDFAGDEAVDSFDLDIGSIDITWEWDDEQGVWLRSQEGSPHDDVLHGRIDAENVIVMVTEYKPSTIDARSPEAQTVGNGPVFVFSDGEVIEGRWQREFNLFALEFVDDEGEVIELTPGPTWIELAPAVGTLDVANPTTDIEIFYAE